ERWLGSDAISLGRSEGASGTIAPPQVGPLQMQALRLQKSGSTFRTNLSSSTAGGRTWKSRISVFTNPLLLTVTTYQPLCNPMVVDDPSLEVCETTVPESLLKTTSQSSIAAPL